MSAPADPAGDAGYARFRQQLDAAAGRSVVVPFWWRDDDAETTTPELERLLALSGRFSAPLALAVIPKGATPELAARLVAEPQVSVLQHGWSHKRHSPPTEKKMELGDHRPLGEILEELAVGRARLAKLFPARFLPVLVPPWNRIGAGVNVARGEVGLAAISLFGQNAAGDPNCVNTHVDIMNWTARRALPRVTVYALLCGELERRLAGDTEPLGILSHHLVQDEPGWAILDELFTLLAQHPAAAWPTIPELFAFRGDKLSRP